MIDRTDGLQQDGLRLRGRAMKSMRRRSLFEEDRRTLLTPGDR
jgi:hypothetical protein